MEHIKPLEKVSRREKFFLRLKSYLTKRATAYVVSGAVGATTGVAVQNIERDTTGYHPDTHKAFLAKAEEKKAEDFSQFKKEKEDKEKSSVLLWLRGVKEKMKSLAKNPRDFIENMDTFIEVKTKYLSVLKFIDDASFFVPALLMFIMLGGYISRKLDTHSEDVVDKEEKERLREKLNEVIDQMNIVITRLESGELLSSQEVRRLLDGSSNLVRNFNDDLT